MAQRRQSIVAAGGGLPSSVSLKVLRLSQPSLIAANDLPGDGLLSKASKPYPSAPDDPFALSPLLQLPPAFGAAYVGTTFSCTLCANNELSRSSTTTVRDVHIGAELQTPAGTVPLELGGQAEAASPAVVSPGQTLQRIVRHDLREDGQHVLAVTVTYTQVEDGEGEDAAASSKRTFRKLYQFVAQPALGVRTKIAELQPRSPGARAFALEAQLENLTEVTVVLGAVTLVLARGLASRSLNWDADWARGQAKPVLAPQDVMQVAFVLEQKDGEDLDEKRERVLLAQVHIDWRGPMGEKGELTTGWLGCKAR